MNDSVEKVEQPRLGHGFTFEELQTRDGLVRLDGLFLEHLRSSDEGLAARLLGARADPAALGPKDEGDLLIALGPHLEDFLGQLFAIKAELRALAERGNRFAPIFTCKRLFVQRQAAKRIKPEEARSLDGEALAATLEKLMGEPISELGFSRHAMTWDADPANNAEALDTALKYAAWATFTEAGQAKHGDGVLFHVPAKVDLQHLVATETVTVDGVEMLRLPPDHWRPRDGFGLTDRGMRLVEALDQMNYCIWCHSQGKDSCSKGLKDKKSGAFQRSPFGVKLAGCPLEEKISEMHTLKAQGSPLAAFAVIVVDNPIVAATGHRICNDCMKACIYQKQEPVNIPEAETRILKDVLLLPWGIEIYALLARWNPLNLRRPLPKPPSGYKVLIVGLGP